MEYVTLSNGLKMPLLGYGVYLLTPEECEKCVLDALEVGYRSIDTAQQYENEEQVGSALSKTDVPREDIFLTTKVWISEYGYEKTKASIETSLKKLKTDYIDLVLLHQAYNDYYGAWRALEELHKEDKIKAIGVSNFYSDRLVDFCSFVDIKPMVNQIEMNPYFQRDEEKEWNDKYGVALEAWAPFGEGRVGILNDEKLAAIGKKYGKTVAQTVLRWNIQRGVIVIPKNA